MKQLKLFHTYINYQVNYSVYDRNNKFMFSRNKNFGTNSQKALNFHIDIVELWHTHNVRLLNIICDLKETTYFGY
jgi:hypothetical protein